MALMYVRIYICMYERTLITSTSGIPSLDVVHHFVLNFGKMLQLLITA
jgi:hypothetical protein